MLRLLRFMKVGLLDFGSRLKTQGWCATAVWLFGHVIPKLTGIPVARYSQITSQVYVGAQFGKAGKRRLESLGIHSSVNMRVEYDDMAHGLALVHHCHLPTDDGHAPTLTQMQTGIAFICQTIANGEKVYIHCESGVGRAPTMAAAYFMSQGYSLAEAVKLIEQVRPFVQLTSRQIDQLRKYAENRKTT